MGFLKLLLQHLFLALEGFNQSKHCFSLASSAVMQGRDP